MKQNSTLKKILAQRISIYAGLTLLMLMVTLGLQAQAVKEYTSAEADLLKTDLAAGTYDIYELVTDGGSYVMSGTSGTLITINKNVTIRAKAGLVAKPILSVNNSSTSSTSAILLPATADQILTLQGIEFSGLNSGAGSQPMLVKAATTATNFKIIVRDCFFHDFKNAGENGIIRLEGAGSSIDFQHSTVNNCTGRLLYLQTATATPYTLYGEIEVKNCTFSNILNPPDPASGAVIFFRSASSGTQLAIGTKVTVDHCTFYNFSSKDQIFTYRSMSDLISVTNCIFDQVSTTLSFTNPNLSAPAQVLDYNYLAGFGTPPTGTNTIATALPGYTNAAALNFGLINVTGFIGSDAKTIGDTRYYGTPTSVKGPVQLSGNGKSSFRSYPNPASAKVTFDYTLEKSANVKISVYNLSNQLVKSYMNNEPHGAGSYSRSFDVSDLKTGAYFVRMTTGTTSKTIKVVVRR